MTKQKELELLEKIDALIKSADAGDYIPMTFAGIVEVCKRNIEDDFGNSPVQDWEEMRNMLCAERVAHDETKRQLADSQKMCKEALDENERLRKLVAEWEQNAHDAGDVYCELEKECSQKILEIRNLKAEIVRMKLERMTDVEYAELYEKMEGAN